MLKMMSDVPTNAGKHVASKPYVHVRVVLSALGKKLNVLIGPNGNVCYDVT